MIFFHHLFKPPSEACGRGVNLDHPVHPRLFLSRVQPETPTVFSAIMITPSSSLGHAHKVVHVILPLLYWIGWSWLWYIKRVALRSSFLRGKIFTTWIRRTKILCLLPTLKALRNINFSSPTFGVLCWRGQVGVFNTCEVQPSKSGNWCFRGPWHLHWWRGGVSICESKLLHFF